METSQFVYQVPNAHGSSVEITAMTVDSSGYRLATGAYNGKYDVRSEVRKPILSQNDNVQTSVAGVQRE